MDGINIEIEIEENPNDAEDEFPSWWIALLYMLFFGL
jgi:hypothetical protein